MTGNTVLLGIALGQGDGAHAVRSGMALTGFSVGAVLGARVRRARLGFGIEAAAIAGSAFLIALPSHLPAIATAAAAMGLQTGTLRKRNPTGVKVTYLTGTVTSLWGRLVRAETDAEFAFAVWLTYALGAVVGALAENPFGRWALLLPAAAVALAAATRAPARV